MESRGYLDELGPSSLLAELHRHATSVSACGGGGGDSGPDTGSGLDDLDDTSSWDSEEDERLAQQEWDEGIRQLQLAIQVMLCPFVGKWLGRKSSYWLFARYRSYGRLSPSFFGLSWLFTDSLLDWVNAA